MTVEEKNMNKAFEEPVQLSVCSRTPSSTSMYVEIRRACNRFMSKNSMSKELSRVKNEFARFKLRHYASFFWLFPSGKSQSSGQLRYVILFLLPLLAGHRDGPAGLASWPLMLSCILRLRLILPIRTLRTLKRLSDMNMHDYAI